MCRSYLEWLFGLMLLLVSSSCSPNLTDLKQVSVDVRWQIQIPVAMQPWETYADAGLAYVNEEAPLFLIIRKDSLVELQERYPRTNLQDLYETHLFHLQEEMEQSETQMSDSLNVAGMMGVQGSWEADFKRDRVYCLLTLLQDEAFLYQVFCWTSTENKEELAPLMQQMSASFHPQD